MASRRLAVRLVFLVAVLELIGTGIASWLTSNPEWLVAGTSVAVLFATIVLVVLTEPLVESSDELVKAYDNLRYLDNKRDSIEEARKRQAAWTTLSTFAQSGGNVQQFLAQGAFLVGDPWLADYRKICENFQGFNPGLPSGALLDFTNNKARERKVQFERVLEHLQQRASTSFPEVEDLRDPDAYMRRLKMFPYAPVAPSK